MLFTEPLFLLFFYLFAVGYVAIGRRHRAHLWWVTTASLLFYASFDPRYLPLLVGTGLLDFVCAARIARAQAAERSGKGWLILSIVSNLTVLGFFKYFDFLAASIGTALGWIGLDVAVPALHLALPIGISFYTFQSMSYTVDVYTSTTHARRDPLAFMSALSFFPHLVAGPIVRGSALIPQFERGPLVTRTRLMTGALVLGAGLIKKTAADLVAPIVERYYGAPAGDDLLAAWTGVLGFAAQLYGDFAGYTDIAIGLGLLFGYDFPQNFNLPFLARTPADFWARWHISLSTWLRDYVFFPLARLWGSRGLLLPTMVTMFLAGLWHGAAVRFPLWGLWMGVLIYATHLVQRWTADREPRAWRSALATVVTFYLVVVLGEGLLFRATSLHRAGEILHELHAGRLRAPSWNGLVDLALVLAVLVGGHALDWFHQRKRELLLRPPILAAFLFVAFAFTFTLGAATIFLYFAF
jgi:D-alanyl-lipoteichoic acid acyltransferase DltB (MBOAT superfamily)